MTARIVISIVALACVPICGMIGTFRHFEMMDKVNDRLPKEEQFDPSWWYLSKTQRLRREYKRLYPDGRLLLHVRIATALMIMCVVFGAWGFGFFAK
jgi:hypothetical protein